MRIVFVCLGNICRSPTAEFVFKDILKKNGVPDIDVCSRATSNEECGNGVYPPAARELNRHGINCNGKFAQQLKPSDYDITDLFVCMDESNVRNTKRIFNGDRDGKVVKLLSFCNSNEDIADPWYTGCFSFVYEQIEEGCKALFERLKG